MAHPTPPGRPGPGSPPRGGALAWRLAAIGVCVVGPALAFAYVGGWLRPGHLSTSTIIGALQTNGGVHPGYRRNHAKGVCVAGYFESNGALAAYSTAQVFAPGRTDLVGRLAIPGGNPYAPDSSAPVRSFALRLTQPDGQQWRTGMNNIPVFPVATPKAFYEQLVATRPDPVTHKPDPARVKAFFGSHPETQAFLQWAKTAKPSASFATETYYSLDAFYLVDRSGERHAVRWQTVPETPGTPAAGDPNDTDYLSKDVSDRLAKGPLRWHLVFQFADPGDPVDNATIAWPSTRRTVDAGTIVISSEQPQDGGPCRDINYDPTVVPSGIAVSDDPLLAARSAAYAKSYVLRTGEETGAPGFEPRKNP
ncbi:catalase family peroxidase [Pararobbsia silviterrae]|uniref:Catalase-related peroxidase n=1 Tax=Pararobbsia silviterrae TaxID=1792498 RepID=A0A494Y365_9BURK|nr:catalase family peroxidase [Pararobbsia silviterrae]RKP55893.1 catalase family peroxidase [Pararobbsia silviterrae]